MVKKEKQKHYPEYIRHIKTDIPKRIELHVDEMDNLVSSTVNQIVMKQVERIDNELCKQIHDIAVSSGIDEVYVLDKRAILSALEKQIPQKPIEDGYYGLPCVCPCCGQALDFSAHPIEKGGVNNG